MTFIGVASRDDLEPMERFVDNLGVGAFPHIADLAGDIWTTYEIPAQPSFAFIDDDGSVETVLGALGEDGLTERVERLLATSS